MKNLRSFLIAGAFLLSGLSLIEAKIVWPPSAHFVELEDERSTMQLVQTVKTIYTRFFNKNSHILLLRQGLNTGQIASHIISHITEDFDNNVSLTVAYLPPDTMALELIPLVNSSENHISYSSPYVFILIVEDFSESVFSECFQLLQHLSLWNPSVKFLLIGEGVCSVNLKEEIAEIFRLCWKNKILNVVAAVACREMNFSSGTVLTYDPFLVKDGIWSDSYTPPVLEVKDTGDIYYNKFRNLNGNDVRASMFTVNPSAIEDNTTVSKFRGCDAQMIETLAKYMNATLVMLPNDGSGFGKWNGTVNTGTDGDVMFDRADIAPNTRYVIVERLKVHGYTYPHDKEDLCVLLNKSPRIPQYLNIILPFAIIAWLTILLSMPVSALFWSLIRRFGSRSSSSESFAYVYITSFLKIFSAFLSIAVPTQPTVGRERILFVMWTFFSLIITNTYQGSLTSYLTIPKYMPDIDTMEQLSASGLKILIHPELLPVFQLDTGNPVMDALNRNLVPDIDMEGYPEKIQKNFGTCALVNAYVGQFLIRSKHYVINGFPLLHLTHECPLPAVVAFATPKYSPLQRRFDWLIRRIVEAGLYKKWQKNMLAESIATGELLLISNREGKADPERISLSHLQMPFYLLFLGYFLTSVLFLIEYLKLKKITSSTKTEGNGELRRRENCQTLEHDSASYFLDP